MTCSTTHGRTNGNTPDEASAVGALLTFPVALWRRSLDARRLRAVVLQTMRATATVFLTIIGAFVFIPVMSPTALAGDMVTFLTALPTGEVGILTVVIVLEIGMISPPVGINVFVVKSIAPEVPMHTIFRGIRPFRFAIAVMIAPLVAFPGIAMFLPGTMLGE